MKVVAFAFRHSVAGRKGIRFCNGTQQFSFADCLRQHAFKPGKFAFGWGAVKDQLYLCRIGGTLLKRRETQSWISLQFIDVWQFQ